MRTITLAVVLAAVPAAALANGYSVPNVNPRDLGLAGSAVAAQRDAAAVYANPAALAALPQGPQVSVAVSALDIAATWNAPVGLPEESTERKLAPPAGVFASYGSTLRGNRVAVGAGFNTPFGGNVFWSEDWEHRFRVTTVDRKVYAAYLNGAFQSGPYLRLGGGLIYYRTTEYLTQGLDFVGSEGSAELSASGGALAFQLALEAQPAETVRIAFGYKHKATQKLKGDAAFHGVPDLLRPSLPDQDVEHVLTIPNIYDLAVSWKATKDLLLTAGYTLDRYKVYDMDLFVGSAGTEVKVPRDYTNGYTFRAGAEYRLTPSWELRAGALRDVSGMSSATFSPSLPDASAWAGSVGASWHLRPDLSLSAALFVAIMDRVSSPHGAYDMRAEIFSLGVAWRPEAR